LNSSGKERGEVFCFQRLAKAFIGADSRIIEDAPLAAYIHQGTPARALARKAAQPRRIRITELATKGSMSGNKRHN
jgi:hypothetical protein